MFKLNATVSKFGMERTPFPLLTGVSLVSMGLLAGILVMLVFDRPARESQRAEIRLVERSETENQPPESELLSSLTPGRAFRNVAREAVESVVLVSSESGWQSYLWSSSDSESNRSSEGSGVVITPQGHIVTNQHLINHAGKLHVLFSDKREYEAYTVGVDRSTDLAVIQVVLNPGETVPAMTIGDSEALQLGDWVLAIGNPLELNSTVTAGIVSAVGRSMNVIDADFGVEDFIQTDAAINPGNSGGALVNLSGELVGINTAIATNSGFYEGYGFAIPVNLVIRVASDLIEFGEFRRAYMGVVPVEVDAKLAEALGMGAVRGVFLDQVYEGGAAEIAGLRPGDVVFKVDEKPVNRSNQLQSAILLKHPYSTVGIEYWRDGKVDSLQLRLLGEDHPDVSSWLIEMGYRPDRRIRTARYLDKWGLVVRDKSEEDETMYGDIDGIIIQRVTRQEEIEYLKAGVLIERIDGRAISSVEEATKQLRDADETTRLSVRDQWSFPRMVSLRAIKR